MKPSSDAELYTVPGSVIADVYYNICFRGTAAYAAFSFPFLGGGSPEEKRPTDAVNALIGVARRNRRNFRDA